jgi:hypothetical protein
MAPIVRTGSDGERELVMALPRVISMRRPHYDNLMVAIRLAMHPIFR